MWLRKPPFYSLFEAMKTGSKVTIFDPNDTKKETGSSLHQNPDFGLVETGESRTPRPREAAQNILQA